MSTDVHINSLIGEDHEEVKDTQTPKEGLDATAEVKTEEPKAEEPKAIEDTKPAKPPKGFVPHAALHQERMIRKEKEEELRQTRTQMEQLLTLKQELEALRKGQQQAEEQKLMDEDPVSALRLKAERAEKTVLELKTSQEKEKETQIQAQKQQSDLTSFMRDVSSMTQEYAQEVEDYPQAFNYLMDSRMRELTALGVPQNEIGNIIDQEAIQISRHAMSQNKNPGEIVYNLAKAKGYALKEAKTENLTKEIAAVDKKIENLEKGQQAAKTLSGGSSKTSADGLSLADISSMSDAEFDKAWAEMEKVAKKSR